MGIIFDLYGYICAYVLQPQNAWKERKKGKKFFLCTILIQGCVQHLQEQVKYLRGLVMQAPDICRLPNTKATTLCSTACAAGLLDDNSIYVKATVYPGWDLHVLRPLLFHEYSFCFLCPDLRYPGTPRPNAMQGQRTCQLDRIGNTYSLNPCPAFQVGRYLLRRVQYYLRQRTSIHLHTWHRYLDLQLYTVKGIIR